MPRGLRCCLGRTEGNGHSERLNQGAGPVEEMGESCLAAIGFSTYRFPTIGD